MELRRTMESGSRAPRESFESKLQDAAPRFLACVVEHGLLQGWRTPEDFIRHFPPKAIMESLKDEPELRANILVAATGTRAKVALKKPATSCGSDLQIALDENETDAGTVVRLIDPDDRVRFFEKRALWAFATEGDVWNVDSRRDPGAHAVAAAHVGYIIERALEDELLTHRDVVRGITVSAMAAYLPPPELSKVIEVALELGSAKTPFLEKSLLDAIPVSTLTQHVPLPAIWNRVVVPFIAEAHGFAPKAGSAAPSTLPAEAELTTTTPSLPPPRAAFPTPPPRSAIATPPPPPPPPAARHAAAGLDLEINEILAFLAEDEGPPAPKQPFRIPPPKRSDSVPPRA